MCVCVQRRGAPEASGIKINDDINISEQVVSRMAPFNLMNRDVNSRARIIALMFAEPAPLTSVAILVHLYTSTTTTMTMMTVDTVNEQP